MSTSTRDVLADQNVTIHLASGGAVTGFVEWMDALGVGLDRETGPAFWPWASVERVEVAR